MHGLLRVVEAAWVEDLLIRLIKYRTFIHVCNRLWMDRCNVNKLQRMENCACPRR